MKVFLNDYSKDLDPELNKQVVSATMRLLMNQLCLVKGEVIKFEKFVSRMAAQKTVVILVTSKDWKQWIRTIRSSSLQEGIWDLQ